MDEVYFRIKRQWAIILILFIAFIIPNISQAQCNNWSISAQPTAISNCAANGGFTVTLSGPDVPNLTNVQYSIPTTPSGYSVPLNNSPVFTNIPPGTYTVSAVAYCGSNYVGKNTTVTISGGYLPLTATADLYRPTLSCGAYGQIRVKPNNGRAPFTTTITSAPSGYSGPMVFNTNNSFIIGSLAAGAYTLIVTDACGSSAAPINVNVNAIMPSSLPLSTLWQPNSIGCNSVGFSIPGISTLDPSWAGYSGDTLFKISAQIPNITAASAFVNLNSNTIPAALLPGKTIKDCYGQTLIYTIQPACGPSFTYPLPIGYPVILPAVHQNCNTDFNAALSFPTLACFPITYTIQNLQTGANYGPYTLLNTNGATTPNLPLGSYLISFTTNDGYIGSSTMNAEPLSNNPYSVSITNGSIGLTNYITCFNFYCPIPQANAQIELFSGPPGYAYFGYWPSFSNFYSIYQNMTSGGPGTAYFPAGNYVWKITDDCGTYYLPITVGQPDLYQFTTSIDHKRQTCAGLWVTPKITATNNGHPVQAFFSLAKDGLRFFPPNSTYWPQYLAGDSVLITSPGVYTIIPSANYGLTAFMGNNGYPNPYTNTDTFIYAVLPAQVDINKTQGFVCNSSTPGQAVIYAQGKDGIPFASPLHYKYSLAHQGQGNSGPYIATNTTGVFINFGGNANDVFDLRIEDSCGASAVQSIKILNLQTARLISSNNYVACSLSTVQLTAIYLPNATYAWTGPNGFTSSSRTPVINSLTAQSAGVYHVTITTQQCGQSLSDSVVVAMAGTPPKPLVSLNCDSIPAQLTISNPSAGIDYKWDFHYYSTTTGTFSNFHHTYPSDFGYTKYADDAGSYRAIATDPSSGCIAYSDSIFFAGEPYDTLRASIYSPHLQVCTGDQTTLVAMGTMPNSGADFQWFKDGIAISGATNMAYSTNVAGHYKVKIHTPPCAQAMSPEVIITLVTPPTASINAATQTMCEGGSIVLQANTGGNYTYSWLRNDSSITGATSATYTATLGGTYKVVVSNGGCVATSAPLVITVLPPPTINLTPNTDQRICPGDSVHFQAYNDPSYTYLWALNTTAIPGATTSHYNTATPGIYTVTVTSPICGAVTSAPVRVSILPHVVNLGNDTTICDPGPFSIPLSINSDFTQIVWSTGEITPQITVSASGVYWVKAINSCGSFSDTIRILALADYLPNFPADTLICNQNNSTILSVPNFLQNIHWNTGATSSSITVTQPGVYWMYGESPCGIIRDTINVHFCAPDVIGIQLKDTICEGDCIAPRAAIDSYPQSYSWSFTGGNPTSSVNLIPGNVCYSHEGVYPIVFIASNAGGSDTFSTQVVVLPKPNPRFADTSVMVSYKTDVTLPACAEARTIDWYKDGVLICSNCQTLEVNARYFRTFYHCVVRNGDCMDSCVYKLQVVDIPHDVWLPDAFSPNGDGRNDLFHVITDNPNVLVINLAVYNRWGQRIFNSNLNNGGWDGTVHGTPAEIGDYFWTLQYKIAGSTEIYNLKGDVTVVR